MRPGGAADSGLRAYALTASHEIRHPTGAVEAAALRDGELAFPSPGRDRPLSSASLGRVLTELDVDAVPHGFRSSFRDWAAEMTETPQAAMEAALAHTNRNTVEAAYARSDLFERRREPMRQWSDYLHQS